jgi:uncharacterized repeat protein (TIGR01451 family)
VNKNQRKDLIKAALLWGLTISVSIAWASETSRVSVPYGTTEYAGASSQDSPRISADGRFVALGLSWGGGSVPIRDRLTRQIIGEIVVPEDEVDYTETLSFSLSADSHFIAATAAIIREPLGDGNDVPPINIYVKDRETHQVSLVDVSPDGMAANDESGAAALSADGRFVAFASRASNLVEGDTNHTWDIFVRDMKSGMITRVSVGSHGEQAQDGSYSPAISAYGRFVAFVSNAYNLAPVTPPDEREGIFIHDRKTGQTTRIATTADSEHVTLFQQPAISADGRFVAFESYAPFLVAGDANRNGGIFIYDRLSGQTRGVSVASDGAVANAWSTAPSISADGRFVAFRSYASNLVAGDTNNASDIFVHDCLTQKITLASVARNRRPANNSSEFPSISADGRFVAFTSWASNLTKGDINRAPDVFVRDRLLNPAKQADLSVTQTVTVQPAKKGYTATYVATIQNAGPDAADNVVLTDLLPSDASQSKLKSNQGSCSPGLVAVCRLGRLGVGETATVTATLQTPKSVKSLSNQVSANANPKDSNPANNATALTTPLPAP